MKEIQAWKRTMALLLEHCMLLIPKKELSELP